MIRSYLTSATRALRKHRLYSFINIIGLAVGLAAFFLIGLFVRHERSFDTFHEHKDRIFRVVQDQPHNMYLGSTHFAVTPKPLVTALVEEVPMVEAAVQVSDAAGLLRVDGVGFRDKGMLASASFFEVFSFPVVSGPTDGLLSEPDHMVVTESQARKMFGTTDVAGRQVEFDYFFDGPRSMTIAAVMADVPSNSQLQFDYVVSFLANSSWVEGVWGNNSYVTYGLARSDYDPAVLDAQVDAMARSHMEQLSWIQERPERMPRFYTQRLLDVHLHSRANFDLAVRGDIRYVWLFSAVALLILVTACINYMNLATARAGMRAREVGIRKVAGADRRQLVVQFMGEAVMTALVSVALAAGLVAAALPMVGSLLERDIRLVSLVEPGAILAMIGTALLVGLVSGSWPALRMARMQPAYVLKGSGSGGRQSRLRNVLVVGQFAAGIVLVVGVLIIQRQMAFISTLDTGVDREHLIALRVIDNDLRSDAGALLERLESMPGVTGVAGASHLPVRVSSNSSIRDWEGAPPDAEIKLWNTRVWNDFEGVSGLTFVAGRGFTEERPTDLEEGLVLNEAAIRALGWDLSTAVGRTLEFQGRNRVIGVVQDFHFQSLHEEIAPLALLHDATRTSFAVVRVAQGRGREVMDGLGDVWAGFSNGYPLSVEFMDEAWADQYRAEQRLVAVLRLFMFLALLVAGLGLFGLAAYTAQQRTREIGIRKVLGASATSVVVLLSRDFGRLVGVAFLVGAPLAWFIMNRWLGVFAYRTDVGVGTLAAVGAICLAVALLSTGFQAVRAALQDPVRSLRQDG